MFFLVLALHFAATPEPVSGRSTARQSAPGNGCSSIDPSEARACVGVRIESKERILADVLASARERVARSHATYGHRDNRTAPRFLDRSQTAWRSYAETSCTVSAALGGGSNSAISDRLTACFEEELDRRIRLLRELADGTGSAGQ
jgi:uncharacterized protein YecT (DUF1311 family)